MKTLTIKQPWAGAIIRLGKNIENRSWITSYRGLILIHAGLGWDAVGERWIRERHLDYPGFFDECRKEAGKIIGIVNLIDIKPVSECDGNLWAFGPYCWQFSDSVSLDCAEKIKGKLSLWEYSGQSSH